MIIWAPCTNSHYSGKDEPMFNMREIKRGGLQVWNSRLSCRSLIVPPILCCNKPLYSRKHFSVESATRKLQYTFKVVLQVLAES